MHPFQRVDKHHLVEDTLQVPSFPDSSFLEKPWVFLVASERNPPIHSDNAVGAYDGVEEVHRAIGEEEVRFPTGDHPIEGRRNHTVGVDRDRHPVFLLSRWVSWVGCRGRKAVDSSHQLLAVVDEGFDNLPIVRLVRVSWEVLHVVDTFLVVGALDQEVDRNRVVVVHEIRTVLAIPCVHTELHILAVDNVACAAAFHRAACRRLCAFCFLVAVQHPPP